MVPPLRVRREEILLVSICATCVALFLFVSGFAETFSRGRMTTELLLVAAAFIVPLMRRRGGG